MNKDNIEALASHIENLEEPGDFDMSREVHSCGSPSCFLGFANLLASQGKAFGFELTNPDTAKSYLDMRETEFHSLCYPKISDYMCRSSGEIVDPYAINNVQGAKVLRHLVATGEVDFRVAFKD